MMASILKRLRVPSLTCSLIHHGGLGSIRLHSGRCFSGAVASTSLSHQSAVEAQMLRAGAPTRASTNAMEAHDSGMANSPAEATRLGHVWFSTAALECIASARSHAAIDAYPAPEPAHLLLAILQHPVAPVLPALQTTSMDDIRVVLRTGLLLQGPEVKNRVGHELTNPLHEAAPLPDATKAIIYKSLCEAMFEGSDVVSMHHLFNSLCDDIMPLHVQYRPMAYALHYLLGQDAARQALIQLSEDNALWLATKSEGISDSTATTSYLTVHVHRVLQKLQRALPALQPDSGVFQMLDFYKDLGIYPDAATRQKMFQLALQVEKSEEDHYFKLSWLLRLLCNPITFSPQLLEQVVCLAPYTDLANVFAGHLCFQQRLQLVQNLQRDQLVNMQAVRSAAAIAATQGDGSPCNVRNQQSNELEESFWAKLSLWDNLKKGADRSEPVHDLVDAARCVRGLDLCTPENVVDLAKAISSSDRYTDKQKVAAIHGLLSIAGVGNASGTRDHSFAVSGLKVSVSESVKTHLPAGTWPVQRVEKGPGTRSKTAATAVCYQLDVFTENKPGRTPSAAQLYDVYSTLGLQMSQLSLEGAAGALERVWYMGRPPPALLPSLLEAVSNLMDGADLKTEYGAHRYLKVLQYYQEWSKQAMLLPDKAPISEQQPGQQQCSMVGMFGTSTTHLPGAHQLVATQILTSFTADLQAEEPVSLQVLGQQVAEGSVSAGQVARQLLQHHSIPQPKQALAFLCLAVPPTTIKSLPDMAACLLMLYQLKADGEVVMVSRWLKSARDVLLRLLWRERRRMAKRRESQAALGAHCSRPAAG